MKKAILLVVAALAIPTSVALAAKPAKPPKNPPKVSYVLKGTLSNYTAYDSVTPANGSITIVVKHGNKFGKAFKGQTLTFPVDANTAVELNNNAPIANGDKGIVKVRAVKKSDAAALQAIPASQIVDQGQ